MPDGGTTRAGYDAARAAFRAGMMGALEKSGLTEEIRTRAHEEQQAALVAWRRTSLVAREVKKDGGEGGGSHVLEADLQTKGLDEAGWLDEDRSREHRKNSVGEGGGEKEVKCIAGRGERFRDRRPGEWEVAYSTDA